VIYGLYWHPAVAWDLNIRSDPLSFVDRNIDWYRGYFWQVRVIDSRRPPGTVKVSAPVDYFQQHLLPAAVYQQVIEVSMIKCLIYTRTTYDNTTSNDLGNKSPFDGITGKNDPIIERMPGTYRKYRNMIIQIDDGNICHRKTSQR
jgi:hypothetical protein